MSFEEATNTRPFIGFVGSFKGQTHSDEAKAKISLANKGKPAWNKGKTGPNSGKKRVYKPRWHLDVEMKMGSIDAPHLFDASL